MVLIDYAQTHKNEVISVVGESVPFLKRGVVRDFLNILETQHYFSEAKWNRTDYIYQFETGSIIEFFSADNPAKVRGPRRDVLYLNEANNIHYEFYTQIEIRTKKIVWIDSNPTVEYWIYTEVIPKQDIDFITLTYRDNETIPEAIRNAIEARKDNKNWYKVYGLGQLGEIEGKIYKGWNICDEIPHEARLERTGLDFGYTNDPSAIVDIYFYNGGYILDEVSYERGLGNKAIADVLRFKENRALVIADSAEPKSIDEVKSYGISILPATKGPGSVNRGISFVQNQRISITKRSVNTIKEYRNYIFLVDKNGLLVSPQEEDPRCENHSMSAVRYALDSLKPRETETIIAQQRNWQQNEWKSDLNLTE